MISFTNDTKRINITAFAVMLGLAFFWGMLSIQHYLPSSQGFLVGLYVLLLASVGLAFGYMTIKIVYISHSVIAWLAFFIVMLLQPIFNHAFYLDDHVLLSVLFLWCAVLSVLVTNFDEGYKRQAVHVMAIAILLTGVLNVLSQLGQLFVVEQLVGRLLFWIQSDRLMGNIAQVNQAAYITTLAIGSVFYFWYQLSSVKTWHWLVAGLLMVWFGMGLGFSASRGGLLLAVGALMTTSIFYQQSIKSRILMPVVFAPILVAGYQFGTFLMNHYLHTELSAVGRLVGENSLYLRGDLLEHAYLAFLSNPIFGVGFGGFKAFGLSHMESIPWFTAAHHAHNFIAQIGAELGLLGLSLLLYFAFILLKNLRLKLPTHQAFAYSMLMLTFMYSLSEYPLWYIRYLVPTVFFISVIDKSAFKIRLNFRLPFLILSILFIVGSFYYIKYYYEYSRVAYEVVQGEKNKNELLIEVQALPNVFGYGAYRDLMLYQVVVPTEENLDVAIQIGERVLSAHYDGFLLTRQAHLLGVIGEYQKAYTYYQAACLFNNGDYCQNVISHLYIMAQEDPMYQKYLEDFSGWYQSRFDEPMPKSGE